MEKKLETREDRVKKKWVGTHVSTYAFISMFF